MAVEVVLVLAGSYLLGTIPVGIWAARGWAGVDPRTAGSKNIGFTNVLRVAGTVPGVITLLGDMGKGAVAVLVTRMLLGPAAGDWVLAAGACAILGHMFPVFLQFKGGKGVATGLGVLLAVDPVIGGLGILIWLLSAALWRTSSLAAVIAFGTLPALVFLFHRQGMMLVFAVFVTGLILYRHRDNIRRLLAGTEPKLGMRSKLT